MWLSLVGFAEICCLDSPEVGEGPSLQGKHLRWDRDTWREAGLLKAPTSARPMVAAIPFLPEKYQTLLLIYWPLALHGCKDQSQGWLCRGCCAPLRTAALGISLHTGLWAKAEITALTCCSHASSAPARHPCREFQGSWDSLLMLLSALHSLPALPGDSIQLPQKELKTQTPF